MTNNKNFADIANTEDRHYARIEYKDAGYRLIYSEKDNDKIAIGLRMVGEVYYDEILAGGMANKPSFEMYMKHFINAQWGDSRYPDEALEILEKEFGEIDGPACVMPGYSIWAPDFQRSRTYLYEVLPKLTAKQKQQIKGL